MFEIGNVIFKINLHIYRKRKCHTPAHFREKNIFVEEEVLD